MEEITRYTTLACPGCYSVLRRDDWHQVDEELYNQAKQVADLMEVNCPNCYNQVMEQDLDAFFNKVGESEGLESRV